MIMAMAFGLAVFCIGLVAISLGGGQAKPTARLSGILRDLDAGHVHSHLHAHSGALSQVLTNTKYALRKRAEKQLLQIFRYAMIVSLFFFAYTRVLVSNPPEALKTTSLLAVIGSVLPIFVLKKLRTNRCNAIEKSLINVMDLVVIGLEAGMALPAVLREIVHLEPNKKDPLKFELEQMLAEMDTGLDLNKALKGLAVRCEIDELRTLATSVVQADRVGAGLAQTFRIYSDDLSMSRREKFRTKIQKLPIKMLVPMLFFLIGPMIALIIGPAAIQIVNTAGVF